MTECAVRCLIYGGCIHDVGRSADGHEGWWIRFGCAGEVEGLGGHYHRWWETVWDVLMCGFSPLMLSVDTNPAPMPEDKAVIISTVPYWDRVALHVWPEYSGQRESAEMR